MPLKFAPHGDILNSDLQTIICPVNCIGVMGKGLALGFAQNYKGLLYNYRKACERGDIAIVNNKPRFWIYKVGDGVQQILCFPTKDDWRNPSEKEWIYAGVKTLARDFRRFDITSLGVPRLGCGEGGLEWDEVGVHVAKAFEAVSIPVTIYADDPRPYQTK